MMTCSNFFQYYFKHFFSPNTMEKWVSYPCYFSISFEKICIEIKKILTIRILNYLPTDLTNYRWYWKDTFKHYCCCYWICRHSTIVWLPHIISRDDSINRLVWWPQGFLFKGSIIWTQKLWSIIGKCHDFGYTDLTINNIVSYVHAIMIKNLLV